MVEFLGGLGYILFICISSFLVQCFSTYEAFSTFWQVNEWVNENFVYLRLPELFSNPMTNTQHIDSKEKGASVSESHKRLKVKEKIGNLDFYMKNFISVQWLRSTLFWVALLSTNQMIKMKLGFLFRSSQKFQVVYVELAPSPPIVLPSSWHLRSKLRPREERRIAQNPMLCKGQRQVWIQFFLTQVPVFFLLHLYWLTDLTTWDGWHDLHVGLGPEEEEPAI